VFLPQIAESHPSLADMPPFGVLNPGTHDMALLLVLAGAHCAPGRILVSRSGVWDDPGYNQYCLLLVRL
jgi:hypothetical protein